VLKPKLLGDRGSRSRFSIRRNVLGGYVRATIGSIAVPVQPSTISLMERAARRFSVRAVDVLILGLRVQPVSLAWQTCARRATWLVEDRGLGDAGSDLGPLGKDLSINKSLRDPSPVCGAPP
jgi:hypothetical protein